MTDSWIWTRYWQYDRVASCMDGSGQTNYTEEVASGWRNFFRKLAPGSVILDLCTGNGAIALLGAEVGRQEEKDWTVIGIDKAAIDPKRHVRKFRNDLQKIDFRPGVEAEKLPFSDQSVDCVVSQYGIEYSDLNRSLAEVARVLSHSGKLRVVVHAAEGIVANGARRSVADADFLLESIDLPAAAARCLEAVLFCERSSVVPADAKKTAEESLTQFQASLTAAAEYLGSATDPLMIRTAGSVLADTFSKRAYFELSQLLEKVDEVRIEIAAHRSRSLALIKSALGEESTRAACSRLSSAGVEVTCSPLKKSNGLIGYVLEGSKNP